MLPRNTVTMAAFFFMIGLFAVGGSVHTVASSNDSTRRVTQTSGQVMGVYNTYFNFIKGLKVSSIGTDDNDGRISATMVAGGAHDEAVPSARQRKSKAVRALKKLPFKGFMLDLGARR